ncbi:aldose 1-epimerase [Orenia metallireducens]|uniref:Aldose 1-epimerase n=1 Tax=Orenia metallireducens TaxID=1413210 RepID=A0A285ICY8_9FIRM|nr:aldose epimerase family protein [Orenia metallireducens]PRX20687.1 aldose 1-epimerase [Orenia metallireducens]SNY44801.1 aldose 1-epimerase [Orenia metallireducens]
MEITKKSFGKLATGEEVIEYILKNEKLQVNVLNYGGIITKIYAPDKNGKMENVVLGYDNLEDYLTKSPYFGAIIGRHAGRISNAEFKLNGEVYQLAANENENNLHGGTGLDKRIWEVTELENGLELSYFSPHLEEGFPADVEFVVRYLLVGDTLEIEYQARPDRETIINLTNHSYFNLSGEAKTDILNHELMIKSEKFLVLDEQSMPTGEIREVEGTPFDFREFKEVGQEIAADYQQLKFTGGYDHPYVLEEGENSVTLKDKESGRVLSVSTDQPVLVFYAGNQIKREDQGVLNSGQEARKHLALCLETQDYPDAINVDSLATKTYTPEKIYTAKSIYSFYID